MNLSPISTMLIHLLNLKFYLLIQKNFYLVFVFFSDWKGPTCFSSLAFVSSASLGKGQKGDCLKQECSRQGSMGLVQQWIYIYSLGPVEEDFISSQVSASLWCFNNRESTHGVVAWKKTFFSNLKTCPKHFFSKILTAQKNWKAPNHTKYQHLRTKVFSIMWDPRARLTTRKEAAKKRGCVSALAACSLTGTNWTGMADL